MRRFLVRAKACHENNFWAVRVYKRIAGKKWTRDVLLCTILREFSGRSLSSFRADRPTAYRKFLRISDARELWAMTTRPCRHSCPEIKVVWRLAYPRKKHNLRTYYVVQSGGYFSTRYNLFIPACREKGLFGRFGCISGSQAKNGRATYFYVQSHVHFGVQNHFCIPACLEILDSFLYCTDVIRLIAEPPRTERPQTSFAVGAEKTDARIEQASDEEKRHIIYPPFLLIHIEELTIPRKDRFER